jgi:ATP-dependent DNA helicase DinG
VEPPPVKNAAGAALRELHNKLRAVRDLATEESDRFEVNALMERTIGLADLLDELLQQVHEDWVYWIDVSGGSPPRITLHGRPIDIGPQLKETLFGVAPSVVLTSATLTTGGTDAFGYMRDRLHLPDARASALGSPFDFARQVKVYVEGSLPDPGDSEAFVPPACDRISAYIRRTDGRAFVLFTSYGMMNRCAERLGPLFDETGIEVLVQGRSLTRSQMLERFREDDRCVIFGTDSFWGGVDVPGKALSNVIIVKLPFAVPDHPAIEARIERIRRRGGNPFFEFQLPEAILRFRQGFGRLIRSRDDTGIVVILDPRVRTRGYGRAFLDALPECEVIFCDEPSA